LSGETPDWRSLAHRREFEGIHILKGHRALHIDIASGTVETQTDESTITPISYDSGGSRDRGQAAIFHGMAVADLSELDLTYTPPMSTPWDPVQIAAQSWSAGQARSKHRAE
jgi:hypothetical protein